MAKRWKSLNSLNFYEQFGIENRSDYIIELLHLIHVWLIALLLAIREFFFDFLNFRIQKKIQKEIKCMGIEGKTALLIGADGSIGNEIGKILLKEKINQLICVIHENSTPFPDFEEVIDVYKLDLTDIKSINNCVKSINNSYKQAIDVVIFATGTMLDRQTHLENGIEKHLHVNCLAPIYFYDRIEPKPKRCLFMSSATARMGCYDLDNMLHSYAGPYQAYTTSKLMLTVYVHELAERVNEQVASIHPGVVPTRLYRHTLSPIYYACQKLLPKILRTRSRAAALVIHASFTEELMNGEYYEDTEMVPIVNWICKEDRRKIYECLRQEIDKWKNL